MREEGLEETVARRAADQTSATETEREGDPTGETLAVMEVETETEAVMEAAKETEEKAEAEATVRGLAARRAAEATVRELAARRAAEATVARARRDTK